MAFPNNRIKFRHLMCFLEVAHQKSFNQAADKLFITQPAVSKAIRELEEELGTSLFDRNRGGVCLTSHGTTFHRYATASISALRQGIEDIAATKTQAKEPLAIGALPTVATSLIPEIVNNLSKTDFNARLRIITGPNSYLLSELRSGNLDLVVGRLAQPEDMKGLTFEHLYSEHICLVVRVGHPLSNKADFQLKDIMAYTVLLPSKDSIIRREVDRMFSSAGVDELPNVIETVSPSFAGRYLQMSDAVWCISHGVVAKELSENSLCELPAGLFETIGPIGLTTPINAMPKAVSEQFKQALRTETQA